MTTSPNEYLRYRGAVYRVGPEHRFPGQYAPGMELSHGCTRGLNHVHRVFHAPTAGVDDSDGEWIHVCLTTGVQVTRPRRHYAAAVREYWCTPRTIRFRGALYRCIDNVIPEWQYGSEEDPMPSRKRQAGSLEKIPGVSMRRLRESFDQMKAAVVEQLTSPYHGAEWEAEWKVTAVNERNGVTGADLIAVAGSEDEMHLGGQMGRTPRERELGVAIDKAVVKALRGLRFTADATFGWSPKDTDPYFYGEREYDEERRQYVVRKPKEWAPGDIFRSEGATYYRTGLNPNAVPGLRTRLNPIKVRIAGVKYNRRDAEIRIVAEFSS